MRIVFAGTPDFAAATLLALLAARHEIVAVYTQPDRAAGRGRKIRPGPVKALALERDLPVEQPLSLRGDGAAATLARYRPDLMVVAAYGLILPQTILDIPAHGCINVHASLLPRWRGAAPIQRAIMAGDPESGVTIMQMDAGLDTGDMLQVRRCPIGPEETGGSLHDRLAELGATALVETLARVENGDLQAEAQPPEGVTYAARIEIDEAWIDWTLGALEIERQVRAFNPWPVARSTLDTQVLRIWAARASANRPPRDALPGQIVAIDRDTLEVATGAGTLIIERLQRSGGKALGVREFTNGVALHPGQQFAVAG